MGCPAVGRARQVTRRDRNKGTHKVMNLMGPVVSQYSREVASRIPMDPNLRVAKSFAV